MKQTNAVVPLSIRRKNRVLVLSINNPSARNALSPELYTALIQALQEAANNDDVGAIVLTGEGQHFCSGGDLRCLATRYQQTLL